MSLLSFLKEAGEKLFHLDNKTEDQPIAAGTTEVNAVERSAEQAILDYIFRQNLLTEELAVKYNATTKTVTVTGVVPDQATREKVILCCGNVQNVEHVDDQMQVKENQSAESRWYTVKSGDTLSKIAKDCYGDASRYMAIFEANKPMLTNPDKIYPGQVLRVPAL